LAGIVASRAHSTGAKGDWALALWGGNLGAIVRLPTWRHSSDYEPWPSQHIDSWRSGAFLAWIERRAKTQPIF